MLLSFEFKFTLDHFNMGAGETHAEEKATNYENYTYKNYEL